jgi:hypothetical protein
MTKRRTKSEFIQSARKVHGDKYDYSLVDYVNNMTKVKIICPIHGEFEQKPVLHLSGRHCAECGREARAKSNTMTTEQFIEKSKKAHGDKYDYSQVNYVHNSVPVDIICPKHGLFRQTPIIHSTGHGCKKCGIESRVEFHAKDTAQFIKESIKVHGKKYDYSIAEYTGCYNKLNIICPSHGTFPTAAYNHLLGRGCPLCAESGFRFDKKAILYFVKFQKTYCTFWKIGVTNNNIRKRYEAERHDIIEQYTWNFPNGKLAYELEQSVLSEFQIYRIKGFLFPLLRKSGNTECFEITMPYHKVIKFIDNRVKNINIK